jgi:hypothetical protein
MEISTIKAGISNRKWIYAGFFHYIRFFCIKSKARSGKFHLIAAGAMRQMLQACGPLSFA